MVLVEVEYEEGRCTSTERWLKAFGSSRGSAAVCTRLSQRKQGVRANGRTGREPQPGSERERDCRGRGDSGCQGEPVPVRRLIRGYNTSTLQACPGNYYWRHSQTQSVVSADNTAMLTGAPSLRENDIVYFRS